MSTTSHCAKLKYKEQAICNSAVTSARKVLQRNILKLTAKNECFKQLSKELTKKAVPVSQKKEVRNLPDSKLSNISVCLAFSLKKINAFCHGCHAKLKNSAFDEILWPETSPAGQSSCSLTTVPFSVDIREESFFSSLVLCSCGKHYSFSILSQKSVHAANVAEKLSK